MASDLQSNLISLQQSDYTCVVVMTAIIYDYVLTFPREVEYVWNKPWTWVSSAFILIRYFGLCAFIMFSVVGTSFLPGPANVSLCRTISLLAGWTIPLTAVSMAIEIVATWAVFIFICAADFVMILRIWAMYNRSKIILILLLASYTVEIIPSTIACIIYSNPKIGPFTITQVLSTSFCQIAVLPLGWNKASSVTQLIHGTVMFVLVIIRFIMQSLRMYRATKQWQLNTFINLFVLEGVLYFLFMLVWNIINSLFAWNIPSPTGGLGILVTFVSMAPIATMAPRFVLTLRALYVHNARNGPANGIDSAFGLSTLVCHDTNRSMMVFADRGRDEEMEVQNGEETTIGEGRS